MLLRYKIILFLKKIFFLFFYAKLLIFINMIDYCVYANSKLNTVEYSSSLLNLNDTSHSTINVVTTSQHDSSISTSIPIESLQSFNVTDTTDCLKKIPGFSIIRNGGTNNDIIFRSMNGSQIRVLMDNSEIISACSAHMDPATSYIDSETFDILNFIKGPQTVLWGPIKSGGLLQFQRYHPNFCEPQIQLRGHVSIGSNNNWSKKIDSIIGNKNGYIRLIGNHAYSEDYQDGNHYRVHSAWYKWNADTILSYNLNKNTSIEINFGQGNGRVNYSDKILDGLCFARENFGLKTEIFDINDLFNKIELQTWSYHIHHLMGNTRRYDMLKKTTSFPVSVKNHCCSHRNIINSVDRMLWGIRNIASYQWKDMLFHSGLDMQINQHKKNVNNTKIDQIDSISKDIGIFTEMNIDFLSNKKFTGGFRLEHNVININNEDVSILYKNRVLYPTGFIRYEINTYQPLLCYFGFGTSQRFPDYWELISNDENKYTTQLNNGNTKLKPEKVMQIDFGMNFKTSEINSYISSYMGYIKDFIFYDYNSQNVDFKNSFFNHVNNIHAKICGSEIGLNYKFNDSWSGTGNMSWNWGMNMNNKCVLPSIPPIEGTVICQFKQKKYKLETACRLVSSKKCNQDIPVSNYLNQFTSNIRKNKVPGFGIFSICATWNNSIYYKYSIGVNNIFNHSYFEYLTLLNHVKSSNYRNNSQNTVTYEPGRTWWIKATIML